MNRSREMNRSTARTTARTTVRTARLAGAMIGGALLLAGCSGSAGDASAGGASAGGASAGATSTGAGNSSSAAPTADVNDADVAFAQNMIVHHQGALEMAQLADGRAQDPRVLDLAARIEQAQTPEIDTMTGWLQDWGQPSSAPTSGSMGGMDMSGGSAGGTAMDTSALAALSGAEFDRRWLQMMTEHHSSAVDMAKTEVANGQNPDAVALAQQIVDSQTAEIQEMQALLKELDS